MPIVLRAEHWYNNFISAIASFFFKTPLVKKVLVAKVQGVICVSGNPVFEFCMQLRLAPSAHLVRSKPLTLTDPASLWGAFGNRTGQFHRRQEARRSVRAIWRGRTDAKVFSRHIDVSYMWSELFTRLQETCHASIVWALWQQGAYHSFTIWQHVFSKNFVYWADI